MATRKGTGRIWRYQSGNQNPYNEEEQATQYIANRKGTKGQQRSTKHIYKTKDRVTRTHLWHRYSIVVGQQHDKQQSPNITHLTKDRVTRTPVKTCGELRWSGRVRKSCSTSLFLYTLPSAKVFYFIFFLYIIWNLKCLVRLLLTKIERYNYIWRHPFDCCWYWIIRLINYLY